MPNHIHCHLGQDQMQAEVILASKSTTGAPPIITVRGRLPRCIWPEVLTHRVFARNARSSRAVPVAKLIDEVRETPFVPWHWGKNQKGMQAREEHDQEIILTKGASGCADWTMEKTQAWISAAENASFWAQRFNDAGYHKQIVNRLLEPFMWIDVLITSTAWDNFFWLRDHEDAEPHLRDWARVVKEAITNATYQTLEPGEWHLPYVTYDEQNQITKHFIANQLAADEHMLQKISAARCARISYKPFDDTGPDILKDLHLYEKLVGSDHVHASPLEHQASPDELETWNDAERAHADRVLGIDLDTLPYQRPRLHGCLTGWVQYRKLIPNECV